MTTIMVMASPISTSTFLCTSSVASKSTTCYFSPLVSYPKASNFSFAKWFPQLDPALFCQWSGLKHLGISISPKSLKLEKKGRCKGKVVQASLFGVGAPEVLVIGVVALLVFGPKGLAEVARNLGKTLRAFQPTIRELQEVSREFKSTLEREIGLDEMSSSTQNTLNRNSPYLSNPTPTPLSVTSTEESGAKADPNGTPSLNEAYTSEEYLKITEEQLKASASQQQGQTTFPGESQLESQIQHEATANEPAAAMPPSQKPESET
ncbi:sec-independent protein translocase protein TATB, chloroplastic-like [Durio zibethinus]|uniref:Sec-independent protein translocase protein TATB, chloroplastic-like n=1 Tax=Durio zibethinus TaxID=66656 RepID=A0A6P6AIE9_DURZI|nr:sec-independent protein translocase protein TATB, chloroplastic-like [Durio zibethinus]